MTNDELMTTTDLTAVYKQFERMAYSHARRAADRCCIPLNDLIDVSLDLLADLVMQWPDLQRAWSHRKQNGDALCSPSTWVYRKLAFGLLHFRTRIWPKQHRDVSVDNGYFLPVHARAQPFIFSVSKVLSDEAYQALSIIVCAPSDALCDIWSDVRSALACDADKVCKIKQEIAECL